MTIKLALTSLLIGLIFGLLGATAKLSKIWIFRKLATTYTSTMRGIPELLLVLFLYYGTSILLVSFLQLLHSIDIFKLSMVVSLLFFAGGIYAFRKSRQLFFGLTILYGLFVLLMIFVKVFGHNEYIEISPFIAGVAALSLAFGAYATEVFRMAIQEIPEGQWEAAQAIGMRPMQIYFRIIIPQVWRLALPGLGNLFLVLLKDTALVSVVGLHDIMYYASRGAQATQEPFTFYMAAAVIYLSLTVIVTGVMLWLEWRANPAERYGKRLRKQMNKGVQPPANTI